MARVITLTTDFGLADAYVGVMKGVILGIAPEVQIVDISHLVAPQDVLGGSFLLQSSYRFFPAGTVHLAVVDPGVGTSRRPVAAQTPGGIFVAPDNGLIALVLEEQGLLDPETGEVAGGCAVEIADPRFRLAWTSNTFHGRDVFAPAAAHFARGVPLSELGPPVLALERTALPPVAPIPGGVAGVVVRIDHFGNAISNIPATRLVPGMTFHVDGREVGPLSKTYQDGPLVALEGSTGLVEIAARNGSAAQIFGFKVGDQIQALTR